MEPFCAMNSSDSTTTCCWFAEAGRRISRSSRNDVAAVYPPPPAELRLERLTEPFSLLLSRLRTVRGEVYSGVLRQVHARRIVLEQPGEGMLVFDPADVVWIWFPHHHDRAPRPGASEAPASPPSGARIALLGLESPRSPLSEESRRLYDTVQQAAFLAGLDAAFPEAAVLADPARLTPRAFPVAVLADADGGYLESLEHEGDARSTLLAYVEAGGTLLVYSRRGAMHTPIRAVESRLERGSAGRTQSCPTPQPPRSSAPATAPRARSVPLKPRQTSPLRSCLSDPPPSRRAWAACPQLSICRRWQAPPFIP
jgi:hypothetical protein